MIQYVWSQYWHTVTELYSQPSLRDCPITRSPDGAIIIQLSETLLLFFQINNINNPRSAHSNPETLCAAEGLAPSTMSLPACRLQPCIPALNNITP